MGRVPLAPTLERGFVMINLHPVTNKLLAKDRKRINKVLHDLTVNKYFDLIPLDDIFQVLQNEGIVVLQEDGMEWAGMLCGGVKETVICYFDIADQTRPEDAPWDNGRNIYPHVIRNAVLSLSYYQLGSGRWEIVTYIAG